MFIFFIYLKIWLLLAIFRIYLSFCSPETRIENGAGIRFADPHHLSEDPDAFHLNAGPDQAVLFNADPDPGSILSLHSYIF